jgi:hypothetical protein
MFRRRRRPVPEGRWALDVECALALTLVAAEAVTIMGRTGADLFALLGLR